MSKKHPNLATLLAAVPKPVRTRMLADADRLLPGAAAVVGRFFAVLAARHEPPDAPSRACFDAAAASEPTLRTLLVSLEAYAPEINLAGGREARKAWYARRPSNRPKRRTGLAPIPQTAPENWPAEWAALYPALVLAPIRETSLRRHIASINRCADALGGSDAAPDWSRYSAFCLLEAFEQAGHRPATISSYLGGLIALAKHGGVPADARAGLSEMQELAMTRARRIEKLKVARVEGLTDRGGYAEIVRTLGVLRDSAANTSAARATAERQRRIAAILAIALNVPARTGDVATWQLGRDLIREPTGSWRLAWRQGKTGGTVDMGSLWPEVCAVLDDLVCAGRPSRFAQVCYGRLIGHNWLTHSAKPMPAKQPSLLVREVLGVPLHDIRTLCADFLRRSDPTTAANLVSTLLGHRTAVAGEAYRALATEDAAAVDWAAMRAKIAAPQGRALD